MDKSPFHADQGDENDTRAPTPTAERPYRPTDVYDCRRRTGHQHVRTLGGYVYCLACGAEGYARS